MECLLGKWEMPCGFMAHTGEWGGCTRIGRQIRGLCFSGRCNAAESTDELKPPITRVSEINILSRRPRYRRRYLLYLDSIFEEQNWANREKISQLECYPLA